MNCDVCGEPILGKPMNVMIEGAKLVACPRCAGLGKPYVEPRPRRPEQRFTAARSQSRPTRAISPPTLDEFDLVEDYATRIREAREKMGLNQQDLASKVKEKLSIIQKIESGKIAPETRLCRQLEHSLRVVLLTEKVEIPASTLIPPASTPTLGDIVKMKRKSQDQ